MRRTITAVSITLLTCLVVVAASPSRSRPRSVNLRGATPRFEDFPVNEKFKTKPAAVRLASREAKKYRTVIREGASKGPNFAGHFTIVEWGCGAGCVQFAIVNAITGAVLMPPFYVGPRSLVEGQTAEPDEPLQYRLDSKLLIVSGSRNEKGEGIYYYKWDGKRLVLINGFQKTHEPSVRLHQR